MITLFAAFISLVFGIIGNVIISTTTGFLTFDLENITIKVVNPQLILFITIIFGICMSVAFIRSMVQLTRLNIAQLEQEVMYSKKRKVRIRLANIDAFLFLQGLLGILILIFILEIIKSTDVDQIFVLFLPLILILLVISPLSFLIGFISTYNRLIPSLIQKIGNFFWEKDWGLLATTFRNLSVNPKMISRITILIACTLSFLIILASLPVSIYEYNIDRTYYSFGSDIAINLKGYDTETIQELKIHLKSINGLDFTSISQIGFEIKDSVDSTQYLEFLGIDENFHQVAHWRSHYDNQQLYQLVYSLFNSSESYPIVIDSNTAQKEELTVKNIYMPFITETNEIEFYVEGVSNYWPGLIDSRSSSYQYIITKRSCIENISIYVDNYVNVNHLYFNSDKLWCKVFSGNNQDVIINQILKVIENIGMAEITVQTVRSRLETNQSPSVQFLWVITNYNFIDSLVVVMVMFVLFSFMRLLSHSTEIGLSRALGMKYNQVFLLMFMEPLILFLISGVPGGLIGLLLLTFSTSLFSSQFISAPPFILNYNISVLLFIYGSVLMITVLSGVITSFIATRENISTILKVE